MFRPSEHSPREPRRSRDTGRRNEHRGQPAASARHAPRLVEKDSASIQGAWLVAPMSLLALACGLRLAVRGADSSFATCFAVLLGLGVSWIALRFCLPAPQPPACPHCKRMTLVRLDRMQPIGARCLHCGWRDEAVDARQLGTLLVLEPHYRGAVHSARISLGPRAVRRGFEGDSRPRPFGDRPPRGPSGRGRRLR
ncbi:MAG TPA: hypothetical protein VK843_06950 [Planctomycetota bacterium]|nr:hypothetical protein [Planctomycetota bacterium]